jgi:hypothetical protein
MLSEEAMKKQEDGPQQMMKYERMHDCIVLKNVKKWYKEWHDVTKPLNNFSQGTRTSAANRQNVYV